MDPSIYAKKDEELKGQNNDADSDDGLDDDNDPFDGNRLLKFANKLAENGDPYNEFWKTKGDKMPAYVGAAFKET